MGRRLYVNNYRTMLTAQLLVGGTTANVTNGDGATLAGANGDDYFIGTLRKMSGYQEVANEIVKITTRATDALTITRAQEGTAALQFEVGDWLDVDATAGSFDVQLFNGLPAAMRDAAYVPIVGANLATGNTDLYTVPTGKKTLVSPFARAYNPSAGTITFYTQIKVSGVYYRISADAGPTAGTGNNHDFGAAIILNAGESLAINCATTAGLNIRYNAIEFDATDTRLQGARVLALANGNNTLLTVAAGKSAVGVGGLNALIGSNVPYIGVVRILNSTGGSLNYYANVVPSGGSVGSTNQLYPATAIGAATGSSMVTVPTMAAGDFVNINASGAGGTAWVTYYQIP